MDKKKTCFEIIISFNAHLNIHHLILVSSGAIVGYQTLHVVNSKTVHKKHLNTNYINLKICVYIVESCAQQATCSTEEATYSTTYSTTHVQPHKNCLLPLIISSPSSNHLLHYLFLFLVLLHASAFILPPSSFLHHLPFYFITIPSSLLSLIPALCLPPPALCLPPSSYRG